MASLGWQRMCNIYPYVEGQAFSDSVSRSGNRINYSINLCMTTKTYRAYWNYAWYVDMQIGSNVSNNRQVKAMHYGSNLVIQGQEFYQSVFNGNFNGYVDISGKESYITLRAFFHDSAGNNGDNVYWNIPIPAATPIIGLKSNVSNVETENATISASLDRKGDYSSITRWRLEYGVNDYSENIKESSEDSKTQSWNLTDLVSDTTYRYRVTVWNSAGYSSTTTGTFKTEEDKLGYIIKPESTKFLRAWIIKPDGTRKKVKAIRKVI